MLPVMQHYDGHGDILNEKMYFYYFFDKTTKEYRRNFENI